MAAAPHVFAQAAGPGGAPMRIFEKGPVRIRYTEAGSGFPLHLFEMERLYPLRANTPAASLAARLTGRRAAPNAA